MYKSLKVQMWRQFKNIELDFHDQVTILTGTNGSGKTTILNLLAYKIDWEPDFVSCPEITQSDKITWRPEIWDRTKVPRPGGVTTVDIGSLEIHNQDPIKLACTTPNNRNYEIHLPDGEKLKKLVGMYLPSHRPPISNQARDWARISPLKPKKILEDYTWRYKDFLAGKWSEKDLSTPTMGHLSGKPPRRDYPSIIIKDWLLHLSLSGFTSTLKRGDQYNEDLFHKFSDLLKKIMPDEIGYKKLEVRTPDVVVITEHGDFNFDSLSGGLHSLIEVSFLSFLCSTESEKFVLLLDEPENHIHPKLQQLVIPSLVKAFPNCQFVVSTHSPVVVNSVRNSSIYALVRNSEGKIESKLLENLEKSGSANDMLRFALGLDSAVPLWALESLDRINKKYQEQELSNELLANYRRDLKAEGLEQYSSEAVTKLFKNRGELS